MTILSKDQAKTIRETASSIEVMRKSNKANAEAINQGNIDIYCVTISAFAKYKAPTISTTDVKAFRNDCSEEAKLSQRWHPHKDAQPIWCNSSARDQE